MYSDSEGAPREPAAAEALLHGVLCMAYSVRYCTPCKSPAVDSLYYRYYRYLRDIDTKDARAPPWIAFTIDTIDIYGI